MVAGTAAPYLLALRLDGRRVLVAGGGAVATRRVAGLLDAGADVLVVSPRISASLHDLAQAGRIRWESREYAPGDCAGAWLACAETSLVSGAGSQPRWSTETRPPGSRKNNSL